MEDLSKLTSKDLEALLAKKREEEHRQALDKRAAYEGIRAELVQKVENKVRSVCDEVKGLHAFCVDEIGAFRQVLAEYGQLRRDGLTSFTVQEGCFRIEVRSNKVKRFDERADIAASRLIEFLQQWIEGKDAGSDDPMYQLAMTLLERNKYGDLDYKSISILYELDDKFDDPEYTAIMNLFKESHLVEGTATNFNIIEKDKMGECKKLQPSFNRL